MKTLADFRPAEITAENLPAGLELDALVAEAIGVDVRWMHGLPYVLPAYGRAIVRVPRYSTDLSAAGKATEAMAQQTGWVWFLGFNPDEAKPYEFRWRTERNKRMSAFSPTEAHARALGVVLAAIVRSEAAEAAKETPLPQSLRGE